MKRKTDDGEVVCAVCQQRVDRAHKCPVVVDDTRPQLMRVIYVRTPGREFMAAEFRWAS